MFRKAAAAAVVLAALSSMVSAELNFDSPRKFSVKEAADEIQPVVPGAPVGDDSVSATKDWTIMVFINGKNNLEPYLLSDINEMEQIGSNDRLNVVVQAGRTGSYSSAGGWKGTRRYLVKKDADTANITSPVLQDMGKVDMGDYKSVIDFGKWAKQTFPAKHYMLVVWNHGSGWEKTMRSPLKGISYDDETGNHINTPQLGMILKEIGGVDVYGSDACLMQMAEVVYELKDYVPYIVGSEETEPGDGYTYNLFLGPIAANPGMSAAEVAAQTVNGYADHYDTTGSGYTQSYLISSAIPGLQTATDAFAAAIIAANEKDVAKSARSSAQSYAVYAHKDLYHFAQLVAASSKSAEVKAKAQALMEYISGTLILGNRVAKSYSNSHGIAIHMPSYGADATYNELAWAKASKWNDFLTWLAK